MGSIQSTRQAEIEGRKVFVFDQLINTSEVALLGETFKVGPFQKTEYARKETFQYRHWVCEIGTEQIEKMPLYLASRHVAQEFFEPGNYRCFRAYCNMASYGDMLMTHRDCKREGPRVITALWFICSQWETDWGGETLFFDDAGDAAFVVSPKPGRMVIFDGSITHAGRPPNRICFEPRYTLAIKFLRENG